MSPSLGGDPAADHPDTDSTVSWPLEVLTRVLTAEFVHQALKRAAVALVAAHASPATEAAGTTITGSVSRTTHRLAEPSDSGTVDEVCDQHTLVILGLSVQWQTCHSIVVESDQPPEVRSVRLTVRPQPAGAGAPAWAGAVHRQLVTAEFVQRAVSSAVLDAVLTAAPASAEVELRQQPLERPATEAVVTECHEHFITVAGHQIYHYTVCTETSSFGHSSVHLEAIHPKH